MGLSEQQMDYANTLISVPNAQQQVVLVMRFSEVEESSKLAQKNDRSFQNASANDGKTAGHLLHSFLNLCLTATSAPPTIVQKKTGFM